jgi:RNA polymerase sigma-70 factor (ECF subfamily)
MNESEWLAEQFEANRGHLQAVAYRMLGSVSEAEDAVQESWLHLNRSDPSAIENLGGWLTTVVARICLDMLRSRKSRREESLDTSLTPAPSANPEGGLGPEEEALLADSVGVALMLVLDTLSPAERLAFVLHDIFSVPFDEIATVVERSEDATRQLASRARRRVRGAASVKDPDLANQRAIVDAFLAASREGSFDALLAVLDPDVVFRVDPAFIAPGAAREFHGAPLVAKQFVGRARGARPVLVNGAVGVAGRRGKMFFVIRFTIRNGRIVGIEMVADPAELHRLHFSVLDD